MRVLVISLLLGAVACGEVSNNDPDAGAPSMGADGSSVLPETTLTMTPPSLDNQANVELAFESDVADASFLCSLDGAVPTACSSPHELTVDEGEHTFTVVAVAAGSEDPTPASHTWTTDLTPPDTTIVVAPAALDNSTSVSFEFTIDEAGATATCSLDGGSAQPCTSPHSVDDLSDGDHTLVITATDLAGNVEPQPARHEWTIDTATPDTQIDSGPSGAVSANRATFTFSSSDAGPGATFECSMDGASFVSCASPYESTTLSEGLHDFRVRVIDQTGNVDPTPASRGWTVDTIAPTANITSGPDSATADDTPMFTFTVAGNPSVVECRVDGGAYSACTSPHTTSALSDGGHNFRVRVTDAAGNSGTANRGFNVDTIAPVVTIDSGPSGPVADTTPTFGFSAEPGAVYECALDGGSFGGCSSPLTTPSLSQGGHSIAVRARDAVGNLSATVDRNFIVDTVLPVVTITSGPGHHELWTSSSVTFGFSATDANLASVQCRIYQSGTSAPSYSSCTSPVVFNLGGGSTIHTFYFQVRATDAVGYVRTTTRLFRQGVPAG